MSRRNAGSSAVTVTYADGRQEVRAADAFSRGNKRRQQTHAASSQRVTVRSLLGALSKALWREDWQTARRLEQQIDIAMFGHHWRPGG